MNHRTTITVALLCLLFISAGSHVNASDTRPKTFATPQAAADALITAAENYDVATLEAIFGPGAEDIIQTGEPARDREIAQQFAEQARSKMNVAIDPKTKNRAFISIGNDEWPFPVPIVKSGTTWSFDSKSGLNEIITRRIGRNELDAIQI